MQGLHHFFEGKLRLVLAVRSLGSKIKTFLISPAVQPFFLFDGAYKT